MATIERLRAILACRRAGARGDPRRAARDPRGLRRRAAHRDHRRDRRDHHRGHDRRRGHGDHGHQLGLHQALAAVVLPLAAPRRQGAHGHGAPRTATSSSTCTSPRRTATSWSSPRPAGCTGSRCTRFPSSGRPPRARRSSTCCSWRRTSGWRPPSRCASSTDDQFLFFATARGTVKKTPLDAYSNPRAGGIIGINIDEGDRLLDVRVTDGKHHILLATQRGFSIRFAETDARSMGRATRGVRGIALRKDDEVVAMEPLATDEEYILSVAENGVGKRTPVADYRRQTRGGKGIINLKVSAKTGPVIGAKHVGEQDGLMLITQDGKIIRINVEGVRKSSRSTMGVKLMDLGDADRLVAVAKLAERERTTRSKRTASRSSPSPPRARRGRTVRAGQLRPVWRESHASRAVASAGGGPWQRSSSLLRTTTGRAGWFCLAVVPGRSARDPGPIRQRMTESLLTRNPADQLYRIAWVFYLFLAIGGALWVGARGGTIRARALRRPGRLVARPGSRSRRRRPASGPLAGGSAPAAVGERARGQAGRDAARHRHARRSSPWPCCRASPKSSSSAVPSRAPGAGPWRRCCSPCCTSAPAPPSAPGRCSQPSPVWSSPA